MLTVSRDFEREIVKAVILMAEESLDPENFENLMTALDALSRTRSTELVPNIFGDSASELTKNLRIR